MRIGQVAQEAPGTEEPLIEIVLKADTERLALMTEEQTATDPHRIAEIHMRLADIDAHSAEARAATILAGLGFDTDAQQRPASSFSGGWRMRVALASVLFAEPDLLLLDEPTNYLDLEGTLWLENYVARYPHTVLLISHDRDLLNRAVTSIVHLDQKKLTFWRGGYDQFERQRAEQAEHQEKGRVKQEAARKHMEAFVERFRAKASKARQAQSRIKALERMKPIAAIVNDTVRPFRFPEPVKTVASPIIAMHGGTVGYQPGNPVLKQLTLRIDADDRIALLGANGNGKSTFAKLLAGRLKLDTGTMTVAPQLKVAIFAQHQLDDLRPEENAYEHVRRLMPEAPEAKVRARVAQFGLSTEKMGTPAKDLSGGEKARLLMGLSAFEGPNLFILDEPTNHLDIDSRESLIHALNDFPGAVILISHDRHLIEATADRLWLVKDGAVKPYDGDLSDYRQEVVGDAGDRKQRREADKTSKADRRREVGAAAGRIRAAVQADPRHGSADGPHPQAHGRHRGSARRSASLRKGPEGGHAAVQGTRRTGQLARRPRGEVAGAVGRVRARHRRLGAPLARRPAPARRRRLRVRVGRRAATAAQGQHETDEADRHQPETDRLDTRIGLLRTVLEHQIDLGDVDAARRRPARS